MHLNRSIVVLLLCGVVLSTVINKSMSRPLADTADILCHRCRHQNDELCTLKWCHNSTLVDNVLAMMTEPVDRNAGQDIGVVWRCGPLMYTAARGVANIRNVLQWNRCRTITGTYKISSNLDCRRHELHVSFLQKMWRMILYVPLQNL